MESITSAACLVVVWLILLAYLRVERVTLGEQRELVQRVDLALRLQLLLALLEELQQVLDVQVGWHQYRLHHQVCSLPALDYPYMCIIFSGWMKLLETKGTRSIGWAARRTPEAKSLVNIIKNIKKH